MKLEFAKYYDITDVAKARNNDYNQYERIFICVDVTDFWIVRILKGFKHDDTDGYVEDESGFILERNMISKPYKNFDITNKKQLLNVLDQDDLGNWDLLNCDSLEEAIDCLDDGFGIGLYVE